MPTIDGWTLVCSKNREEGCYHLLSVLDPNEVYLVAPNQLSDISAAFEVLEQMHATQQEHPNQGTIGGSEFAHTVRLDPSNRSMVTQTSDTWWSRHRREGRRTTTTVSAPPVM